MSNSGNDVLVGSKTVLNGFIVTDENEKTQMPLQWSVHENDAQFVSVQRVGTEVEVVGLRVPPDNKPISITAKVIGDDAVPAATFTVFVKGRKVITDFKPILVRIDMLDERTAKDLFGGRTEAEYHIAKIRIINNLSADQGGGPASSIFFFSDALEVRVSLQKIVVKPKSNEKKEWLDLSADDIYSINNWKRCEPKDVDKQQANIRNRGLTICSLGAQREIDACNRVPRDDVNRDLKIRDCVAEVKLDEIDCQQRAERAATDCGCNQNDTDCLMQCKFCQRTREAIDNNLPLPTVNGQWIPFRPFIYQVVANTHDRRADRSLRHIAFLGANIAGSGLSFFTSFLVPKPSSDLPLFLDKYQNFAIPTFEKLFPSLREVQRQNIINLVLPPIVEVPYGSDVSKYVFFPKKRIIGVLPNHHVRISSISSYYITVSVGVVQKDTVIQR
ncbi:MAG TPA: hypothetical protein VK400_07210 [Pyrinomonadaceae bacterium]|nr:hypothetical protein [Pyrinomonadaceae bacterium]